MDVPKHGRDVKNVDMGVKNRGHEEMGPSNPKTRSNFFLSILQVRDMIEINLISNSCIFSWVLVQW